VAEGLPAWRVLSLTILVNLGLAGIVGAWASMLWLRGAASPWTTRSRRQSLAALKVALAFTAVSDVLLLWLQAAYRAEVRLADASALLPKMLEQTYVGHCWAAGVLGLMLVLGATGEPSTRPGMLRLAVAALGVTVFVSSRAAVSHAGDFGLAGVQTLVESAHLWAISAWIGSVGIAAFVVLPDPTGTAATDRAEVAQWVQTLSGVATGALIVVVGTGLFNAWRGVGSPANLAGNVYGNTLLVKVGLVAIAVALGAFNRFRVMPHLMAALRAPLGLPTQPRERFVRVLRIEAVVLLAVLVAAAVLSSSPLPSLSAR